ncbi:phosphatidylserine decarboxylase [Athelia psychrophila]|uniref:Phosphatidylserine decarboxylase n=1 Tax=Athelia psychrophila TaxID=1759441 RepID=A0A166S715_9AGAM|nr:phosphatidylserine decarboxylase [Fibularhizoctonia sp. CBS 109695]
MPRAHPTDFVKYGGGLPSNADIHTSFIAAQSKIAHEAVDSGVPHHHQPAVAEFEKTIVDDAEMKDLFEKILDEIHEKSKIPSYEELFDMLDAVLSSAPPIYVATDDNGKEFGEPIGVPIYLIFDLLSNTSAGYDLFRLPRFNAALEKLLDAWGSYLSDPSKNSNTVLHSGTEGWFGQTAMSSLQEKISPLSFEATYILPDPQADNRGFKTWDAFLTRQFNENARPVDYRSKKFLLHSACESTVHRIERDVKTHDQFGLKGQNYTLHDILDRDDKMVAKFAGGTVYQAFLSPLDYHRWHAPIDGTIEKIVNIDGSCYPPDSPYNASIPPQPFLAAASSRALIYIRADNPAVGLMCFVGVGIAAASACDVSVKETQHVNAGDELGMFHFGGASHALIFGPQCKVTFAEEAAEGRHVWVNSIIGRIDPKYSRDGAGPYYPSRSRM